MGEDKTHSEAQKSRQCATCCATGTVLSDNEGAVRVLCILPTRRVQHLP